MFDEESDETLSRAKRGPMMQSGVFSVFVAIFVHERNVRDGEVHLVRRDGELAGDGLASCRFDLPGRRTPLRLATSNDAAWRRSSRHHVLGLFQKWAHPRISVQILPARWVLNGI